MYREYFGLTEKPFALTPNPKYVFYSRQYREAETQILYGIRSHEGFIVLTGRPGAGKTTLCRDLLEKLDHQKTNTALLFNPFLNGTELLSALLTEFRVVAPAGATRKELLDTLNTYLIRESVAGRNCLVIFDEAQHLSTELLEQIRVLSNLETEREKLLQIVLVGQPELLEKIGSPGMAQLDQRVSIRCRLDYLQRDEVPQYVAHRLNTAGARGQVTFSPSALSLIAQASGGVPRGVNLICDRALLAAFSAQAHEISPRHVRQALKSLQGDSEAGLVESAGSRMWRVVSAAAGVVLVVSAALLGYTAYSAYADVRARASATELFARGMSATSVTDADSLLGRFVAEQPSSPEVVPATLHRVELKAASGDSAGAMRLLQDLSRRRNEPGVQHSVALWTSRLRLDAGDTTGACAALPAADSARPTAGSVELLTRGLRQVCGGRSGDRGTVAQSGMPTARAQSDTSRQSRQ